LSFTNGYNVKALENFKNRVQETGTKRINRVGIIEFCGVSFAYPGSNRKVLNNISFNVAEGEKVALVGMNGSGKSTLIKLLLRYYDVDEGVIRINGEDIMTYDLFSLRSCFSVYFQDMLNYSFTLSENLTIADLEQVGQEKVLQAYQESCADDIVNNAKMGLDTYLTRMFDEDGIELSGGQHQKIALARAFYRRHSALILDEPSSNLDPEAEHKVFEALGRLTSGKTTIFTSHRLSNVGLADRIVVIEDGKVIEQGTQAELLKNPKRFATLYKYQQDKFREAEGNASGGN
jgi:ATP-binding cassette subfamily B protein